MIDINFIVYWLILLIPTSTFYYYLALLTALTLQLVNFWLFRIGFREDAYVNSQSVAGADQKAQSVAVPLYGAEDERQGRAFPAAATAAASASAAAAASARATSVDRRCTTSSSTDSKWISFRYFMFDSLDLIPFLFFEIMFDLDLIWIFCFNGIEY